MYPKYRGTTGASGRYVSYRSNFLQQPPNICIPNPPFSRSYNSIKPLILLNNNYIMLILEKFRGPVPPPFFVSMSTYDRSRNGPGCSVHLGGTGTQELRYFYFRHFLLSASMFFVAVLRYYDVIQNPFPPFACPCPTLSSIYVKTKKNYHSVDVPPSVRCVTKKTQRQTLE